MTAAENPFQPPQAPVADSGGQTEPVKILSISGRLNRVRYIGYSFGLSFLMMIVLGILAALLIPISPTFGAIAVIAGYVLMIALGFALTIQRCHDFNVSGWLSLLALIPLAVFVFWFVPGTQGENKYGRPNPPNSALSFVALLLLPVFLIGILAAVAIPAYQDYSRRAKAAEMRRAAPPAPATAPADER